MGQKREIDTFNVKRKISTNSYSYTLISTRFSNFRKVDAHNGLNIGLFDDVLDDGLHDEVVSCAVNWIRGKLGMIIINHVTIYHLFLYFFLYFSILLCTSLLHVTIPSMYFYTSFYTFLYFCVLPYLCWVINN